MPEPRTAADLLRRLREARGRTLRAAADDLGVAASQLSRIERGQRGINHSLAGRISRYYDIDVDRLLLAEGQLPTDVINILLRHPEEIEKLRSRYSAADRGESADE